MMTYTPEVAITPMPHKAIRAPSLRSPTDAELQAILVNFVPAHAQFGELTFLRALREQLEERGLAMIYTVRSAVLQARQGTRARPARR